MYDDGDDDHDVRTQLYLHTSMYICLPIYLSILQIEAQAHPCINAHVDTLRSSIYLGKSTRTNIGQ